MGVGVIKFKEFPQQTDLIFDDIKTIEGEIRLYKTPHGNFPSMTSVLSILDDGSNGLENWRNRIGHEEADKITKEASDRGNSLHDLSEKYLLNQLKREDVTGPGYVLFNRVKKYLDEIELVIGTEVALYSKTYKYAGRTDAIVLLDDMITILDHKNSRGRITDNRKFLRQKIHKYKLQITGYAIAFEEMTGIPAKNGCLIVGNHKTSTSNKISFPIDNELRDELLLIVSCYNTKNLDQIKKATFFKID